MASPRLCLVVLLLGCALQTTQGADVNIYKSGGSVLVVFLSWTFQDICENIMKGHPFVDPLFAPSDMARQCSYTPANFTFVANYDLHGDFIGAKVRGEFMTEIKLYDPEENLLYCVHAFGHVRKDTLN